MRIMPDRRFFQENILNGLIVIGLCWLFWGCAENTIPSERYGEIVEATDSLRFGESDSLADRLYTKHNIDLLPQALRELDADSIIKQEDGVFIFLTSSFFGGKGLFVPQKGTSFSGAPRKDISFEKLADRLYRFH